MESYTCPHCENIYKFKFNYQRHVGFCEFTHKSVQERNREIDGYETIPSPAEMFSFMKELMIRINKLETENAKLKQHINYGIRKFDVLTWLHNNALIKPNKTFYQWIEQIDYEVILQQIFDATLLDAIVSCFDNEKSVVLPIYAFSHKPNSIYLYDDHINNETGELRTGWHLVSNEFLGKWINYIAHKLLIEFEKWVTTHKDNIDNDEDFYNKYIYYYQKVLGGKMQEDVRNQRIRAQIFQKIKQSISSVQ
jgi:hypothetical protein